MLIDTLVPDHGIPTYVSRRIPLLADEAPRVFEEWWRHARRRSRGVLVEVIEIGDGRLELDAVTWQRSGLTRAAPYRRVGGWLKPQGARGWPVELELSPWSAYQCELGLRFTGRRARGIRRLDRYFDLAARALETVGAAVLATRPIRLDGEVRRPDAA